MTQECSPAEHVLREASRDYLLSDTTSKPFLHHLAALVDLNDVQLPLVYTQYAPPHERCHTAACESAAQFFGV